MKPNPNLLLLLASSLVALLAAELGVRLVFRSEVDARRLAEANARTSFGAFTRPSRLPGLVYELRPGTRFAWNELPRIAISSGGPYRVGEDGEAEVTADAARVAVVGDSTSFGWGVPFDAAYPEVLRHALEDRLGRPVALRNFSVPGYNSEQERIVFAEHVLPWRPRLVVLHYDHNDWEPAIREKPPTYLDPAYGDNPLRSALLKLLARRLWIAGARRVYERTRGLEHRLHEGYAYEGPLYDRHLEALGGIAGAAAARGIPVVCLVFDADLERAAEPLESAHYRLLHRGLAAELTARGFFVLELFHPYRKLMAAEGWEDLSPLWLAPDDAHPNEAGHGLIAQALAQFILGNAPLAESLSRPVVDNTD